MGGALAQASAPASLRCPRCGRDCPFKRELIADTCQVDHCYCTRCDASWDQQKRAWVCSAPLLRWNEDRTRIERPCFSLRVCCMTQLPSPDDWGDVHCPYDLRSVRYALSCVRLRYPALTADACEFVLSFLEGEEKYADPAYRFCRWHGESVGERRELG